MILSNLSSGINTLLPYLDENCQVLVEYGMVYIRPPIPMMTEDDVQTLFSLGWFQPEAVDDEYDPEAGWSFT